MNINPILSLLGFGVFLPILFIIANSTSSASAFTFFASYRTTDICVISRGANAYIHLTSIATSTTLLSVSLPPEQMKTMVTTSQLQHTRFSINETNNKTDIQCHEICKLTDEQAKAQLTQDEYTYYESYHSGISEDIKQTKKIVKMMVENLYKYDRGKKKKRR